MIGRRGGVCAVTKRIGGSKVRELYRTPVCTWTSSLSNMSSDPQEGDFFRRSRTCRLKKKSGSGSKCHPETVEDLTFKLVNEIDVETTKQAIDRFAAENRELIKINADRLLNESRMATHRQEMLRKERQQQREAYLKELEAEQLAKSEDRKSLIQGLATSDKSAKTILAARQAISLKKTSMRKTEVKPITASSVGSTSMFSNSYWWMQQNDDLDRRQQEEEEDQANDNFDPAQSLYMDVELGVGYVNSVNNNNKAHAGGLVYPLLTSSIGVKDLYVEPLGVGNLSQVTKAGGYWNAFGYERAIEDAHTAALYLPGL
ncbi:CDK-activating kinase assembly factor MAT1-domain-containing protein [Linnemannia elongata]|nr:CDK-activating kinase assembly factor MAT1-domain-containing protein [Linnemannia elongata]